MKTKTQNELAIFGSVLAAAALWLRSKKKQTADGVGATNVEYAIYALQRAGIPLELDFFQLSFSQLSDLAEIRKKSGYRQSKASAATGRSASRSFYYFIQEQARKQGLI